MWLDELCSSNGTTISNFGDASAPYPLRGLAVTIRNEKDDVHRLWMQGLSGVLLRARLEKSGLKTSSWWLFRHEDEELAPLRLYGLIVSAQTAWEDRIGFCHRGLVSPDSDTIDSHRTIQSYLNLTLPRIWTNPFHGYENPGYAQFPVWKFPPTSLITRADTHQSNQSRESSQTLAQSHIKVCTPKRTHQPQEHNVAQRHTNPPNKKIIICQLRYLSIVGP